MKTFQANVNITTKATIDSHAIGNIIEDEMRKLIGGSDHYIENGIVHESDYRFNGSKKIREATKEEIHLYEALLLASRHFKKL